MVQINATTAMIPARTQMDDAAVNASVTVKAQVPTIIA